MKKLTRVDVFSNVDEYIKFMEWAKTKNPTTRADMVRLLGEYKRPDLIVDGHPEQIEHRIHQGMRAARLIPPKNKGDQK